MLDTNVDEFHKSIYNLGVTKGYNLGFQEGLNEGLQSNLKQTMEAVLTPKGQERDKEKIFDEGHDIGKEEGALSVFTAFTIMIYKLKCQGKIDEKVINKVDDEFQQLCNNENLYEKWFAKYREEIDRAKRNTKDVKTKH